MTWLSHILLLQVKTFNDVLQKEVDQNLNRLYDGVFHKVRFSKLPEYVWYVTKKSSSDITFLGDITSVKWSASRAAGAQRLHLLQRDGRAEGNGHDQIPDQGSQDACCHQSNPPKVSSGQIEYWIWNCVGIKPDDRHADVPNYQNPGL